MGARRGSALVAGAVVAAVGLLGGCGGGGGGAGGATPLTVQDSVVTVAETGQQVVKRASTTTAAAGSGRMTITMKIDGDISGTPIRADVRGQGRFAAGGSVTDSTIDMSTYVRQVADATGAPPRAIPSSWVMGVVVDGPQAYLTVRTDPPALDDGVWYRIDLGSEANELALSSHNILTPGGLGAGPVAFVDALVGADASVKAKGFDEVGKVDVTRYEGTLDPAAALQAVAPERHDQLQQALVMAGVTGPVPFAAWIDDSGVVRRVRLDLRADLGTFGALTIAYTVELDDMGAGGTIQPPTEHVEPLDPGRGLDAGGGDGVLDA